MNLSAIVITKNEQDSIKRCLDSLDFADEIIVVDAESTDNTREIAEHTGAKVFTNSWPGYGPQKNFGADKASGEWLLFIDADEEVTTELANAITETLNHPTETLYWLRITTVFLGKPLYHLYGHNPRLFKKTNHQWDSAPVHEQVENIYFSTDSPVLKAPLLHHSHKTIKSYLEKMHHYTTLDAQKMAKTQMHRSGRPVKKTYLLPWHLSLRQFIKLYFYKKGFLDGYAGFIWSVLSAYYEFEMANKYHKLTV